MRLGLAIKEDAMENLASATIFAQLMSYLPQRQFQRIVARYKGNLRVRKFSCWDQFLCMAFAQLTYRESLRDIEVTLRAIGIKLYHLGIRGKVSRSTLADANNNRDCRIFAEFAELVIAQARELYCNEKFGVELTNAAYCLDASVIDLCLSLCPWAKFNHTSRGGIKLHTLLDLRGNIPAVIVVTPRKTYELAILDTLLLESGAFYIMDRGYFDWRRLYRFNDHQAFFIIRARDDLAFRRLYSKPVDQETRVISDHIGVPRASYGQRYENRSDIKYPGKIRRVRYKDPETEKKLTFLTNNFDISAQKIAELYRARWQVELFFKWIKQHLRIKAFYGTSENAVKIQVYIAVTIYVLIAIVKKQLLLPYELYTVLQVLSVMSLEKMPISYAFSPQISNHLQPDRQISLDLPGF